MEERLTPRQLECLRLAATMTDKEIARHIGISPHTVSLHIGKAMRRLGVSSRRAALRALAENPLYASDPIPPPPAAASDQPVSEGGKRLLQYGGPRRSLYGIYVALGAWRTPPRWFGTRVWLILAWALAWIIAIGAGVAVLQTVFEVTDPLNG